MRGLKLLGGVLALGLITVGTVARADDPADRTMKSKSARERDRAAIRELNLRELDHVRQRDARYAKGWQATRDYPRQQAEYERRMAEWRRAVRLCESGHTEYCAR